MGAVFAHGHAGAGEEHLLHKGVGAVSALEDHCRNRKARVREKVARLLNEYVFYFQSGAWGPIDYVILMGKEIK